MKNSSEKASIIGKLSFNDSRKKKGISVVCLRYTGILFIPANIIDLVKYVIMAIIGDV